VGEMSRETHLFSREVEVLLPKSRYGLQRSAEHLYSQPGVLRMDAVWWCSLGKYIARCHTQILDNLRLGVPLPNTDDSQRLQYSAAQRMENRRNARQVSSTETDC